MLIVSLAAPAFAGAKFEKNFAAKRSKRILADKKTEPAAKLNVDSGLGRTNTGGTAACPDYIVCVVNGVIVTGDAMKACNSGHVEVISQCRGKARL